MTMKLFGPVMAMLLLTRLIMLTVLRLVRAPGLPSLLWQNYRLDLYMYVCIMWTTVLFLLTTAGLVRLLYVTRPIFPKTVVPTSRLPAT